MKGINKFIQGHKKSCIIGGGLFFGLILVFFIIVFIIPSLGNNNYGDRLKDESKYQIKSSTIDNIKDSVSSLDGVTKVSYHKEGRILNFTITLEDDVNLDSAKGYADEIINKLKKPNLKYYDVQIFLDADSSSYPIIGYHSKESDHISWGNAGEKQ